MLLPPAFLLGVLSPRGRWDALAALSGPAGIAAEPARNFTAALTGSVAGTVSNAGTGNLLEGAHVELPTLGIVAVAVYREPAPNGGAGYQTFCGT